MMHTSPFGSYRMSAMRATPYPNRLLDLSATLPETQLRILNLIVRLTLGWQAGANGERRATTQISLWQIKKRIGRSSVMPVAEAIAALADLGVIEARDLNGEPIDMRDLARARRRALLLAISRSWVEEP